MEGERVESVAAETRVLGSAALGWLLAGLNRRRYRFLHDVLRSSAITVGVALPVWGIAAAVGVSPGAAFLACTIAAQGVAGAILLVSPMQLPRLAERFLVFTLAVVIGRSATDGWAAALFASAEIS